MPWFQLTVHIRASMVGPGVVGDAVQGLVNKGTIGDTRPSVSSQRSGGSICHEGSRNSTPCRAPDTLEQLHNSLDLRVVVDIGRRVGIDTGNVSCLKGWKVVFLKTHPIAFTVDLWPEYRAEAELALSVMKVSIEWV